MKQFLLGVAVALLLSVTPTFAATTAATPTGTGWSWFEKTQGVSRIDSVKIWTKCLGAEDSAAHLRLRQYGNGTAVYGCYRKGY
jgi:hypothetical protein